MMEALGPHAAFIVAAYVTMALCVGGLVAWVVLGERTQRRRLNELERQGFGRRSRL